MWRQRTTIYSQREMYTLERCRTRETDVQTHDYANDPEQVTSAKLPVITLSVVTLVLAIAAAVAAPVHATPPYAPVPLAVSGESARTGRSRELVGFEFVGIPRAHSRDVSGLNFVAVPLAQSRAIPEIDFIGVPQGPSQSTRGGS